MYIDVKLTVSRIFSQELKYVPWTTKVASTCDSNGFKSRFSTCNKTKQKSFYTDLNISVWQMEIKISRGYVYPTTFLYFSK